MHVDNEFAPCDAALVMSTKELRAHFALHSAIPQNEAEYVKLEDMLTMWHGPKGTPERERHDRQLRHEMRIEALSYRVVRHLGPVGCFWQSMLFAAPGSLRGAMDALSSEYLGDFMFWGQPITTDYYESWVSKVHLFNLIHVHTAEGSECSHVPHD